MAQAWLDPGLAQSAQDALGKILSVLPADARTAAESLAVFAPGGGLDAPAQRTLQTLREAVQARNKIFIQYLRPERQAQRTHAAPAGLLLLGQSLDTGRVVRNA
jgi:predicted DNA-binding transcriptional regulator YafY